MRVANSGKEKVHKRLFRTATAYVDQRQCRMQRVHDHVAFEMLIGVRNRQRLRLKQPAVSYLRNMSQPLFFQK